jgi:hypothetical protein
MESAYIQFVSPYDSGTLSANEVHWCALLSQAVCVFNSRFIDYSALGAHDVVNEERVHFVSRDSDLKLQAGIHTLSST